MKKDKLYLTLAAGLAATGVATAAYLLTRRQIPEFATPVEPFDAERYMGKWHELARFESRIEKNLKDVTEEYSFNDDGTIKVITRARKISNNKPVQAEGKIKFVGANDVGMLKVSYFGPFYAAYNVLAVDQAYEHALVSTNNLDYLWILSRTDSIPQDIRDRFLNRAAGIGFDLGKLQWM